MEEANRLLDESLLPLVKTLGSGEIGRALGYLVVRYEVDRYGCVEDVTAAYDTMRADVNNFRGTIGADEEGREVKEDAVADVRLMVYEVLKGLVFSGAGGDGGDGEDDKDDDDGEIELLEGCSVVILFAFE